MQIIITGDKMTNKILLAKNISRGNLITPGYEQSYYVYFLPKVVEDGKVIYTDKLRLEIVAPSSNGEDVHKSYQMIDPAQERLLILDLIKGYLFHKRALGQLQEFTLNAVMSDLMKSTLAIGRDVQRGLYDKGD